MRPAAALFDVDGTLVDTVEMHVDAWIRTFRRFDVEVERSAMHAEIGKGGDQLLPDVLDAETVERQGEAIEQYRADLFKREYLDRVRGLPGTTALFQRLREGGVRIALASSCKQQELAAYIERAGIAGLFEAAVTGDDVEHSKPAPDIFQAAAAKLGVEPADAVAIGDSPWDARSAGAAGVRTVGLLSGGFSEGELRDAGAVEVWRDCADLLANLDRSALGGG